MFAMRSVLRMLMFLILVPLLGGGLATPVSSEVFRQRNCDIGPDQESCAPRQVCDMIRNICIPECTTEDCCRDVACPEGSACVPWRGQCGTPAGPTCFDLGSSWWTGSGDFETPVRTATKGMVDFIVRNMTGAPIHFQVSSAQPRVQFNLYTEMSGSRRKLNLPENQFCPNWCPDTGPVRELDCRKPDPAVFQLGNGDAVRLTWSGSEMVTTYRSCSASGIQVCNATKPSRAGLYLVEMCAHSERTEGRNPGEETNPILGADVIGPARCVLNELEYPTRSDIEVVFAE